MVVLTKQNNSYLSFSIESFENDRISVSKSVVN